MPCHAIPYHTISHHITSHHTNSYIIFLPSAGVSAHGKHNGTKQLSPAQAATEDFSVDHPHADLAGPCHQPEAKPPESPTWKTALQSQVLLEDGSWPYTIECQDKKRLVVDQAKKGLSMNANDDLADGTLRASRGARGTPSCRSRSLELPAHLKGLCGCNFELPIHQRWQQVLHQCHCPCLFWIDRYIAALHHHAGPSHALQQRICAP